MARIYKYKLNPYGETELELSEGSNFLCVNAQDGGTVAYFECPYGAIYAKETVTVKLVYTGEDVPEGGWVYVKTLELKYGLVVHVYVMDKVGAAW